MAVLAVAAGLRLPPLNDRPMHADEATGARILSWQLEGRPFVFDPAHFHGPWLTVATAVPARALGAGDWTDLSKAAVRAPTALAGLATVLVAALLPRALRVGGRAGGARPTVPAIHFGSGIWAAAFVGTSPLLVYYSGVFIHEPWAVLFGLLSLLAILRLLVRPGVPVALAVGLCIGLMAAVRETFVIAVAAWGLAAIFLLWRQCEGSARVRVARVWALFRPFARPLAVALGAAAFVTIAAYTGFGRDPGGILDFLKTYFVYETTPGHEKPWDAYLRLLLWPKSAAGFGWTEMGVALIALIGYFHGSGPGRDWRRFLVDAAVLQFLVYSLTHYKTPWLIMLPWAQVCLAAGWAAGELLRGWPSRQSLALAVALLALCGWQATQAYRAVFVLPSDERNPYAYVPTSPDLERATEWLEALAAAHPGLLALPPAVVGVDYWPLPWYLRHLGPVGYYATPPPDLAQRPLVFLAPPEAAAHLEQLRATHQVLPRGLRHETPLFVCIRRDVWAAWMANG